VPPHPAPADPMTPPPAEGVAWVVARLREAAAMTAAVAQAPDPVRALAPARPAIAALRGVALVEASPALDAALRVLGRLAAPPTGAPPPSEAVLRPMLELASRLLEEGAADLAAGRPTPPDGATALALAALVRAARPVPAPRAAVHPIASLTGAAGAAPRPAALARFRQEAQGIAERLRDALAQFREARDPIAADEAAETVIAATTLLLTLAGEYGLGAVTDCLEAARAGVPAADPRALWVLDEAGVELAEPVVGPDTLIARFVSLRARLEGVQPPPTPLHAPAARPSAGHRTPFDTPTIEVVAPPVATTAPAPSVTAAAPVTGASLAAMLHDGIAAFARETGPLTPVASPLPDARDLAYRGPSARAAARALREALARGERAATPAALDELHDLLRLADAP